MDYLGGINNFYLFGKIEIRDYYLFYVYNDIENDLIF